MAKRDAPLWLVTGYGRRGGPVRCDVRAADEAEAREEAGGVRFGVTRIVTIEREGPEATVRAQTWFDTAIACRGVFGAERADMAAELLDKAERRGALPAADARALAATFKA